MINKDSLNGYGTILKVIITPVLLVTITSLGKIAYDNLKCSLDDLNAKMFIHLTNDELHAPRSLLVLKPEWEIYQKMRDKQTQDVKDELYAIRRLLEKQYAR